MTQEVNAAQGTQQISYAKMSERSPQVALALLMMDMAELNKANAQAKIGEIEEQQKLKKECSEMLNYARECKVSKNRVTRDGGDPPYTTSAFNAYCDKAGIKVPNSYGDDNDDKNRAEWDTCIAQLQTKLDTIGGNTQTQMVQLQDLMGQYNSQIQGANSAIAQANQVLTAVAKGG